jgi:hypothetical protein
MDKRPVAHLQIGGELPYVVVGYRRQFEDSEVDIVAIYGPVPSEEDAEALGEALTDMGLGNDQTFSVVPAYVVRPVMVTELPVEIDLDNGAA